MKCPYICIYMYSTYRVAKTHRGLIFIGHFPPKSPIISGSFARNDRQPEAFYGSSPPCTKCTWYIFYIIYMYLCIFTYVYVYTYIRIYRYDLYFTFCACIHVHSHMCRCIHIYVYTDCSMSTYVYTHVYVYMHYTYNNFRWDGVMQYICITHTLMCMCGTYIRIHA